MGKNTIFFLLMLAMLLAAGPAAAEKTIWIDAAGKVHEEVKENPREGKGPQVELYVTSWCPYCEKAIGYFRSRGIPVTVYDIEKDAGAAQRKKRLTDRRGVPFAVVNGQKVEGYAPAAYERALQADR